MTHLRFNVGTMGIVMAAICCLSTGVARGDEARDESVDEWFDFIGNLNASGMLEPAGSHGSIGMTLAAGASSHAAAAPGTMTSSLLEKEDAAEGEPYVVPRMWLLKGLPWPVDVGMTVGGDAERSFTQASGYMQWTVYEEFARPALSLRGGYGRLFGLPGTEIASTSVDAVASYGFLRYFTVYGAIGATNHKASITVKSADSFAFLLTAEEDEVVTTKTWITPTRSLGLRVMILPPFVAMTAETQVTNNGRRSYAAKIGVGL